MKTGEKNEIFNFISENQFIKQKHMIFHKNQLQK